MEKILSFLGLIRKAGKLEIGAESVETAAAAGKARLILSASDAAPNSLKQAKKAAETGKIKHIVLPFGKSEIGSVVGRGLPGMLAVTDAGFAAALVGKLCESFPDRYGDAASAAVEIKNADAVIKPGKRRM